ncbi:hypothetical protein L3N51_01772 [Metallosphaera sp. J1]|uniref:hypothetical protein n=1 Tax=Metallosphaera TaxID=41980 RepID=UPI001EE1120F|nr:hypothetical protein [Metallosphaera javensis (ex Hofmann et al. 2022)]MCG3109480.1 hypothetical protein [Metallosphaera javensis (ex Hofmann et al. 2022)]BCS93481.1 MAG: hypothetical protein MjAS7_2089 [Metallosphaera javensis (ex Sakai et al. 2022)]
MTRNERDYARMSLNDFLVAVSRLRRGCLRLSAFRAYKSERRLLQALAVVHGLRREDTYCAVPKAYMIDVSRKLEVRYPGIVNMTVRALTLFNQWREGNPDGEAILTLLKSLEFNWISSLVEEGLWRRVLKVQKELD